MQEADALQEAILVIEDRQDKTLNLIDTFIKIHLTPHLQSSVATSTHQYQKLFLLLLHLLNMMK